MIDEEPVDTSLIEPAFKIVPILGVDGKVETVNKQDSQQYEIPPNPFPKIADLETLKTELQNFKLDPGFSGRYKQLDEARKRAQQKELEEEEASARASAQQRKEQREDRGQRGLEDEGSEASSSSPQLKAAAP
eukprot:gene1104-1243_t